MLYINYGVPKSGSTLTFELTWKLLELAGHKQFNLSAEARNDKTGREHYTNSVREWTPEVVAALEQASPPDSILLVRTHNSVSPPVAGLIERGLAKHMVGLRDPRDIALSMLDVVTRLDEKGRSHHRIRQGELESTLHTIDANVAQSTAWADLPGALMLDYEQTAFSHERTLDAICRQLGLPPSQHLYPQIFDNATDRLEPKKNVARPYRHRREMSASDQQMFLDRYADYYARFFPQATVAVEADDERELAALAERREIQRKRDADRKARIEARAAALADPGRAERKLNRQAGAGGDRSASKAQRRLAREEGRRERQERRSLWRPSTWIKRAEGSDKID
jgi:hypothetical protein